MTDLLLIPASILLGMALRAVHRGEWRLHGQLMIAGLGFVLLLLVRNLPKLPSPAHPIAVALFILLGITALLGRGALAWREGHSQFYPFPRLHRAVGTLGLVSLALGLVGFLLLRWC